VFWGRVKWLRRSDLTSEPLCKEPWYRLKSDESTHHCRSPTPKLNGCDLPPSTRIQFSKQEYSHLTASKRHYSTPYSHSTHITFHEETCNILSILSRGRQNMFILLWHAPRISRKFAGVELCSVVLRQQQKPHWVSSNFSSIIFVASWHALFLGD